MNCPVCQKPIVALELNQIEIDHCLACGGIWLDRGELELLLQGIQGACDFLKNLKADSKTTEAQRKCPICSRKMKKVEWGKQDPVIGDECPRRDGLWLDRGELEKVIQMTDKEGHAAILALLKDMFAGSNT